MLANLLNDPDVRQKFDVSLSYRASRAYADGLRRRTRLDFPVFPLSFPEPSTAIPTRDWWPRALRRGTRFTSRQVATYPLLAYEIWLLRRLFTRLAPDLVHINNGGYPAALSARAAAIAARQAGVPHVVMVVNNLAEPHKGLSFSARPAVDRHVVNSVSRFVTGSAAASVQLRNVLGIRPEQTVAYPNGIALRSPTESRADTLRRLGIDESSGVLLGVVASMEPRKGHRVLLESIGELIRIGTPVKSFTLLLEGEGPIRRELQGFVAERNLHSHVRFIGTEVNVVNFMSAIDILVLPSVAHEDFPNVILEAMGLGKAVIASRLAGTPEQVEDGLTGLLVTPGDSRALTAAISRLVTDAGLRAEMGREGRRRFERRFTAKIALARYEGLYQSLIAENKS